MASFTALKAEADSCIERLRECLEGLIEGSLDESTQTDAQLQAVWRSYFALKDRQAGNLQVAVLALAKSGATFAASGTHRQAPKAPKDLLSCRFRAECPTYVL